MKHGLDNGGWARGFSLGAAITLMLFVTLLPRGLTTADGSAISHGGLSLIMWGMSAGFVYGIGFVPRNRVLRVVLGPVVAWMGMGAALIFYVQYFLR